MAQVDSLLQDIASQVSSGEIPTAKDLPRCEKLLVALDLLLKNQVAPKESSEKSDALFKQFEGWMKANEFPEHQLVFTTNLKEGNGVSAAKDLKTGELIACIPRKFMMSYETAMNTAPLGKIAQADPLLRSLPSLVLATYLLLEKENPKSFFQPYIKILPTQFSIPLFYSHQELLALKGSPVLDEILKLLFNTARQYVYLQKLLKKEFKMHLTYAEFRWAVAIVMTRQNQIPLQKGQGYDLVLIPVWDMCNHAEGEITTFFNTENQTTEFLAMRDYRKGDQVYIFYGERPNSDLLLYSGFVYGDDNTHDRIRLRFTVAQNDPHCLLKTKVLEKLSLSPNATRDLHSKGLSHSKELLLFLRILASTNPILLEQLANGGRVPTEDGFLDEANESEMQRFLDIRCKLMLRGYPTTIQQDEDRLQAGKIPGHEELAVRQCLQEKKILTKTLAELESLQKKI